MRALRRERRAKRQLQKRPVVGVCGCTARSGDPKTLFPSKEIARRRAGDTMGIDGKMWEIYKCPDPAGAGGFHIATVRWDPWKLSESDYQEAES